MGWRFLVNPEECNASDGTYSLRDGATIVGRSEAAHGESI